MQSSGIGPPMLGKGYMLPCRNSSMVSIGTLVAPGCSLTIGAVHSLFDFRVSIRTDWTLRSYARSTCCWICLPGTRRTFSMCCNLRMLVMFSLFRYHIPAPIV
ncbi:hypothetical protein V6N12_010580 [Hibiscus sabdariffa]|uniref:Uncharacterized protein n=1 Tax=Hibiscus sabdariffa TaxID=183260 RepID=A0ABR2EM23_9ROSI